MSNVQNLILTNPGDEFAILVGVNLPDLDKLLTLEDSMDELELLAKTAGVEVIGRLTQNLDKPNSKTYLGSGKVEELKMLAEELSANLVIFDEELSPRNQRELEEILGDDIKIIDRTALILDIFSLHAKTREGILQVELAQYQYRLPRLTRAWTHLARQAGGGGGRAGGVGGVGLRGPGEKQLEVDRRDIRTRISNLQDELEKVRSHRSRYREQRRKSQIPVVALVGYTNAGKSTLLNKISGADVLVADQLFATLDPTTRRVEIPDGQAILFTDTVGFIQKLPTNLIAAFRATLEEIAAADLLLHIVDVTHPNANAHAISVLKTLESIEAGEIPIITVLNKIDKLNSPENAVKILEGFPNTHAISAITGEGLSELIGAVEEELFKSYSSIRVIIPYQEGQLISAFHEFGHIDLKKHEEIGVLMQGSIPKRLYSRFEPFLVKPKSNAK